MPSGNAFHLRNDPNAKNINGGKESAQWWSSFTSLSWTVQVSLLCSAGEADLESAMLTDLTNWLRRPALSLAAIWTLLLCWQREHHWADCCPWITALSTTSWIDGASKRLVQLHCHKDRYRKSFLPKSITLYNSSLLAIRDVSSWCLCFILMSLSHSITSCLFPYWLYCIILLLLITTTIIIMCIVHLNVHYTLCLQIRHFNIFVTCLYIVVVYIFDLL